MNIKKGDQVKILKGKDSGKIAKVLRVDPEMNLVTVEGANLHKKNVRPKKAGDKGQVVSLPAPIHVSSLALICSACGKPTRVGHRTSASGSKERYCKKCNATI